METPARDGVIVIFVGCVRFRSRLLYLCVVLLLSVSGGCVFFAPASPQALQIIGSPGLFLAASSGKVGRATLQDLQCKTRGYVRVHGSRVVVASMHPPLCRSVGVHRLRRSVWLAPKKNVSISISLD